MCFSFFFGVNKTFKAFADVVFNMFPNLVVSSNAVRYSATGQLQMAAACQDKCSSLGACQTAELG